MIVFFSLQSSLYTWLDRVNRRLLLGPCWALQHFWYLARRCSPPLQSRVAESPASGKLLYIGRCILLLRWTKKIIKHPDLVYSCWSCYKFYSLLSDLKTVVDHEGYSSRREFDLPPVHLFNCLWMGRHPTIAKIEIVLCCYVYQSWIHRTFTNMSRNLHFLFFFTRWNAVYRHNCQGLISLQRKKNLWKNYESICVGTLILHVRFLQSMSYVIQSCNSWIICTSSNCYIPVCSVSSLFSRMEL